MTSIMIKSEHEEVNLMPFKKLSTSLNIYMSFESQYFSYKSLYPFGMSMSLKLYPPEARGKTLIHLRIISIN